MISVHQWIWRSEEDENSLFRNGWQRQNRHTEPSCGSLFIFYWIKIKMHVGRSILLSSRPAQRISCRQLIFEPQSWFCLSRNVAKVKPSQHVELHRPCSRGRPLSHVIRTFYLFPAHGSNPEVIVLFVVATKHWNSLRRSIRSTESVVRLEQQYSHRSSWRRFTMSVHVLVFVWMDVRVVLGFDLCTLSFMWSTLWLC